METYKDLPVLFFENAEQWSAWLEQHHGEPAGVWLKFAKKDSGITSLNYAGALDEALCYGWIDGQAKTIDETYYMQKFTPRRAKSIWSKRNVGKIADLTKAGRMKPSGIAAVEAAKQDGRWDQAYDGSSNITVPPDFQAMLDSNPSAKEFYESLNKTNTYAILWRIQTAKKPETRQARMEKLLAMLLEGKKLH
ncbi:MAG TPA: YdeI/OmpD-associated family protein [Candidatus Saccharimonadales bacterium]|nr:YdeI/OmpD-associated family protein [Candidatus Saccharimonadales bacterium]